MVEPYVLSLQPYYGGSHRAFMECWQRTSRLNWLTLDLPPRHWKWRMRHSAWHLANAANELWERGQRWQVNFCTDMLNLAEFKGIVRKEISSLPTIIYFHENQLAYPNQVSQARDLHFGITNLSSALAADVVWFNSRFNRDSMLETLSELCRKWPDFPPTREIDVVREKSRVVSPIIESPRQIRDSTKPDSAWHLIWAARWEHDKGPKKLLGLLRLLGKEQFDFKLSVVGQSFRNEPSEFSTIKAEFGEQIVHWGFQETRQQYWDALASADIFVSTAEHEFFGLSACEAIAAGLLPLLPNRLAYPELLGFNREIMKQFFYEDLEEAVAHVKSACDRWDRFRALALGETMVQRYGELERVASMDEKVCQLVDSL